MEEQEYTEELDQNKTELRSAGIHKLAVVCVPEDSGSTIPTASWVAAHLASLFSWLCTVQFSSADVPCSWCHERSRVSTGEVAKCPPGPGQQ